MPNIARGYMKKKDFLLDFEATLATNHAAFLCLEFRQVLPVNYGFLFSTVTRG